MSVFERTIKSVASPQLLAELSTRASGMAVQQQQERDEQVFEAAVKTVIRPAMWDFTKDARANGYWARPDSNSALDLIPVSGSNPFMGVEHDSRTVYRPFLFKLGISLSATGGESSTVVCTYHRYGPVTIYMRSEVFDYTCPVASYDDCVRGVEKPLSEVVKSWSDFLDTALAEFLTYALRVAEAESLDLRPVASPLGTSAVKTSSPQVRKGLLGVLLGRS